MTISLKKTATFAAAALAITFAALPVQQAEARYGRNAALAAGLIGGALIGGALLARPAYGYYGRPAYYGGPVYVERDCYTVRRRVFDSYRGRFVVVRRTVCD